MSVASPTPPRAGTMMSRSTRPTPLDTSMGIPSLPDRGVSAKPSPSSDRGRARSSAGEHYVDIVGVTGSIPVAPTIPGIVVFLGEFPLLIKTRSVNGRTPLGETSRVLQFAD